MNEEQLKQLESQLQERGYRKFTECLVGNESFAWFKTVDDSYQMAFRVWDYSGYSKDVQPSSGAYGVGFWATVLNIDSRIDLESTWESIADIDAFEGMAKDFYDMTTKYVKQQ